jgi:hypothetical protein
MPHIVAVEDLGGEAAGQKVRRGDDQSLTDPRASHPDGEERREWGSPSYRRDRAGVGQVGHELVEEGLGLAHADLLALLEREDSTDEPEKGRLVLAMTVVRETLPVDGDDVAVGPQQEVVVGPAVDRAAAAGDVVVALVEVAA